ncbi:MAG: putative hydroxymethylpyrimidine transporter CytX [Fusobacteriaceae bacterium]|jgi:putative hydroxymethylpyrimidine transporter CytX|nr:putative hydroxymethylpyrimidine transporter CytX [Fusobacteriaceae bacterium]
MEQEKSSTLSQGLIWFGAAVSIAEILTGALFAPLGLKKGFAAIIAGHVIGCGLLYLAGVIGARTGKSAMETVKISFGQKGSLLFSLLNVLQLAGWTAIMIASGGESAATAAPFLGVSLWECAIGALVLVWILIDFRHLQKLNLAAMSALFLLTLVLSTIVFKGGKSLPSAEALSFGVAVELSAAMPLSWLPLISDYTRSSKDPGKAPAVSALVYFATSCWMYAIGMGAALYTGESDIAKIMSGVGLAAIALFIVVFSTVTTTFLDVWSAGVSSESVSRHFREKPAAALVCILGILLAVFTPITRMEGFLYLIGSVFAPMIAILIVDYFILGRDAGKKAYDLGNLLIWLVGFVLYRIFLKIDTPLGNTLPVMILTGGLCIVVRKFFMKGVLHV